MAGLKQTASFQKPHPSVKLLKHIKPKMKKKGDATDSGGASKMATSPSQGALKKKKTAIELPKVDVVTEESTKVDNVKQRKKATNKKGGPKKREWLDKRGRRLLKLKSKKHSALVQAILPLWEVLRRENTSKEKCFEIVEEILSSSKGKLIDLCMAHDTARIIESVVQRGTEAQIWTVFAELKKAFRLLSKSRYAKFVVLKLIKCGAKEHRLEMLKAFRHHFARLVKHRIAAEVIDLLYNDYANATQRGQIMQELYGNVHALISAGEDQTRSLANVLVLNADKQLVILANLSQLLTSLITKGLTKYSIVQHLLLEYLQSTTPTLTESAAASDPTGPAVPMEVGDGEAPANVLEVLGDSHVIPTKVGDDEAPPQPETIGSGLTNVLEVLVDGHVVPMLHTREGVRAGLHALWACPVRLRKTLVRGLKTCVSNIARSEHGHLFLIGLLDTVDDIQLLDKYVIKEIREDLAIFVGHPEARKVLLYALSPRDRHHFPPQLQASLFSIFDNSPYTKKPLGLRAMELRSPGTVRLLPKLLQLAGTQEALVGLFIGGGDADNLPESARLAMEDRGRIILLTEMLVRSAPHHLDPSKVVPAYTRPGTPPTGTAPRLSDRELQELTALRLQVLNCLVRCTLTVPFCPVGTTEEEAGEGSRVDRDALRTKRHKQATLRAEAALTGFLKPHFATFESCTETTTTAKDSVPSANQPMAFIERPEGQLMFRRLLQDGHKNDDFALSRVILDSVPMEMMLSWTQCNRGCFLLVNLCELGDPTLSRKLKTSLKKCIPELKTSWHPGAKVLLKLIKER